MSKKIEYYHESSLYRSPDPSDLPDPNTLFKNFNNKAKDNRIVKNNKIKYNKKATEDLKKLLGIK